MSKGIADKEFKHIPGVNNPEKKWVPLSEKEPDSEAVTAEWGSNYDPASDTCYKCPVCTECGEPVIGKPRKVPDEGTEIKYICVNCRKEVIVDDPEMLAWFSERNDRKIEYEDCTCGGKGTVEAYYTINPVTLKWKMSRSTCRKCGVRIIV